MANTSTGISENIAGLLCYLGWWVGGIIFILLEPSNRYVRFHAMQSIIIFGILTVGGAILSSIPVLGGLLGWIFWVIGLIVWIVGMIKAYQGETFKFPWAGNVAEKWANRD